MIGHTEATEKRILQGDLVKNAAMKVLIGPEAGWSDYVMRLLEVGIGGFTPKHQHPWPHINYVVEGTGSLLMGEETVVVTAGSYAYIPANTLHQFQNSGTTDFKFICIVPKEGHK